MCVSIISGIAALPLDVTVQVIDSYFKCSFGEHHTNTHGTHYMKIFMCSWDRKPSAQLTSGIYVYHKHIDTHMQAGTHRSNHLQKPFIRATFALHPMQVHCHGQPQSALFIGAKHSPQVIPMLSYQSVSLQPRSGLPANNHFSSMYKQLEDPACVVGDVI